MVLVLAVLEIGAQPLEIVHQLEIDHARDGVGPVVGSGASRKDIHPFDEGAGNLVDVRCRSAGQRRSGRHAAAVDQYQGSQGAQGAQFHGRGTGGAVRFSGSLGNVDLRV